MKKTIVLTAVAVVLSNGVLWAFEQGWLRFNVPSRDAFPVHGIDVSHHQGSIRWSEVARENVRFAYIKATEGGDFVDSRFSENWTRSRGADIPRGAYHYFTLCRPGAEQAANFIRNVPLDGELPPAVDLEFGGNCSGRPERDDLIRQLESYIAQIENHYQRSPLLYVTYDFYEHYLEGWLGGQRVWIRDIFRTPRLPPEIKWELWQYHNRGRVAGITGPVDLNVFNGSRATFSRWVGDA